LINFFPTITACANALANQAAFLLARPLELEFSPHDTRASRSSDINSDHVEEIT
jgi:hypothetical protein